MKVLQNELHDQIDSVMGADLLVQKKHLSKLTLLSDIIMEVMRLNPGSNAALFPRQAKTDFTFENYERINNKRGNSFPELKNFIIPKGTKIIFNSFAMQRDKSVWGKDANEFNHKRIKNSNAFAGFGVGNRKCICFV